MFLFSQVYQDVASLCTQFIHLFLLAVCPDRYAFQLTFPIIPLAKRTIILLSMLQGLKMHSSLRESLVTC